MRLSVTIRQQRGKLDSEVQLQCCGELLVEDLNAGVMRCRVCKKAYPLTTVRALIDQAQQCLDGLTQALDLPG